MITATMEGSKGEQIVVLGVTRNNVEQLLKGNPIRVGAESHPGFPPDLKIYIFFGEDERTLAKALKPLLSDETKIIVLPQEKDQPKGVS